MKNVEIINKQYLNRILKNFREEGLSKLHILSDFDGTLLKCFNQGEKISSLISRLRSGNYLPSEYSRRAHELYEIYHPIEVSYVISREEKNKKMQEWWLKHKELLIKYKLTNAIIRRCVEDMIRTKKPDCRSGISELMQYTKMKRIPIVILTAGLEDLTREYLNQKNLYDSHVHIIGNSFHYNQRGEASRIKKLIHVFSKDEEHIRDLSIYRELLTRKNVVLLGDGLGDVDMIKGFPYDHVLKIGFVNEPTKEHIDEYGKKYDVLILNDGSLQYVNQILKKI